MIPGVVASSVVPVVDPVMVQRANATSGTVTLAATPTPGNQVVAFRRFVSSQVPEAPGGTGWTTLKEATSGANGYGLYAKTIIAEGASFTALAPATGHMALWEFANMTAPATMLDGTNTLDRAAHDTGWNPASTTLDQARGVYLCALMTSGSPGTVTTDWVGADDTSTGARLLLGYKIVTAGAAFDTNIVWTSATAHLGGVFCLRGVA